VPNRRLHIRGPRARSAVRRTLVPYVANAQARLYFGLSARRRPLPIDLRPHQDITREEDHHGHHPLRRAGVRQVRRNGLPGGAYRCLVQPARSGPAAGASVTFEPSARTAWHTHPLGQYRRRLRRCFRLLSNSSATASWASCRSAQVFQCHACNTRASGATGASM
jgi:hypothetical protein